jgi:ATP-binding cassette subfamily C protein
LLSGVDLTLPVRSTTAIVGPSGAGKSTLADILAGLLQATGGRIEIDGRELNDRRAWRQSVAYVPQDTFLFNASVRENLLWATPAADETAIWNALELAAAAEFIRALPLGLDTLLGERGIRLSGGERQRLAIARALLRKPALLILDEATSALDRDNEARIQSALANLHGHLTMVVIAHRLATVRNADRIVVMQGGRVAGQGTYTDLAADSRGYIARAQAGAELMPE